jgi:hypothetical protein
MMEELGRDFFLRVQLTRKVVWFVCPSSGNVYHSAAKPGGPGGRAKPGKRYCHLCKKVRGRTRRPTCSVRILPLSAGTPWHTAFPQPATQIPPCSQPATLIPPCSQPATLIPPCS